MTRAFICGCAGLALEAGERQFLARTQPWGLILFKRNVEGPAQLRALTGAFREIVERADAPVFIDQEGGRVQRMAAPHWPAYPAAASFDQRIVDPQDALRAAHLTARLIAHDLFEVGITANCAPVLDVAEDGMHAVIGSRAYSDRPERVAAFGRAVCEGLLAGGVAPVVKHMPGHGRARVDSHLELPLVATPLAELARRDFAPFLALNDMPMAMTAHVVYADVDPRAPATTSAKIVGEVMRGAIGFDGLLISDDLSMKALGGPFAERARAALAAGVDIVLHCNGDLVEAEAVAAAAPELGGAALRRAKAALVRIAGGAEALDLEAARGDLARLIGAGA